MELAVAQDLIRRGEKLVHVRHLAGAVFGAAMPFEMQQTKQGWRPIPGSLTEAAVEIPSWYFDKDLRINKFHRLDILLLEALCVAHGYTLKMEPAAVEAMRKLTKSYVQRLEWKKSSFAGYLEVPVKRPLDRLQNIGANYLCNVRDGLNADGPGSGKTAQGIGAIILNKLRGWPHKSLVVCPTSAKGVWANEFRILTDDLKVIVLDSNMEKRFEQYPLLKDYDVVICGFSSFCDDYKEIAEHFKPDILLIDEAHRLCEKENNITQILIGGRKIKKTFLSMVAPHSIYLLTGTPLNNKREDLYALLKTMDQTIFHWSGFRNRYTQTEEGTRWERKFNPETQKVESKKRKFLSVVGSKNEEELKHKLELFMIRRTKDEILPDLAEGGTCPKIWHPKTMIDFDPEEREIYDDLRKKWKATLRGRDVKIDSHLEWMTRAQQICNSLETYPEALGIKKSSKLKWLLDFVDKNAKDHKIVIFSKFEAMTSIIERELRLWKPLHFHGGVKDCDRFDMWHNKFQQDPKHRVFIATYGAGSVAITLTAANKCVLYDRAWTLKDNEQGTDRLHRRGQTQPVDVYQPCIRDSFDEHIDKVWINKGCMVEDMIGVDTAVKNMLLAEKETLI